MAIGNMKHPEEQKACVDASLKDNTHGPDSNGHSKKIHKKQNVTNLQI